MSSQKKADIALILVTLFWGVSYVMSDYALTVLHPFTLCAARFIIAFLVSYGIFFKRMKNISKATLQYAFTIGVFLTAVYAFTNFGILHTNLTNVGFIVALPVVFTPLINYFFRKVKPEKKLVVILLLATVGMALMTLNDKFVPAFGDVLCLIAALCYSIDIVLTEVAVQHKDVNALQLGVFVIGTVAVLMSLLHLFFGESYDVIVPNVWFVVFLLAIFSTAFAFIVQSVAQQYTSSNHVGLIFTLEPVFAAFAAYFIAGEILLPKAYFGAFLMLLAVVGAEVNFSSIFKREK
ncbi:MAG: DMT family transporter [Clostridia bacterium]|nr:DMT family transporter [Clostridia bacterium]